MVPLGVVCLKRCCSGSWSKLTVVEPRVSDSVRTLP
jgi:hypothetical protein